MSLRTFKGRLKDIQGAAADTSSMDSRNSNTPDKDSTMDIAPASADPSRQAWEGFRTSVPGDDSATRRMWKGTVLYSAPGGREECFAIGPDGYIWSYAVHEAGADGRLISTGVCGEAFGVGHRGDGRLFVAAGRHATLEYATETGGPQPRWTSPRQVVFQANGADLTIEKIMTHHHAGNLFVGVVLKVVEIDGTEHCCLWDGIWSGGSLVLANAPVDWARGNTFWLQRIADEGILLS